MTPVPHFHGDRIYAGLMNQTPTIILQSSNLQAGAGLEISYSGLDDSLGII